jgi:hypothetical protein
MSQYTTPGLYSYELASNNKRPPEELMSPRWLTFAMGFRHANERMYNTMLTYCRNSREARSHYGIRRDGQSLS